jgi:hypothetical protein
VTRELEKPVKAAATVVLLLIASFPLLIAPWLFIPILAAILVAAAIYFEAPVSALGKKITKIAKAIAVGLAILIALGFAYWSPLAPQKASAASSLNVFVSRISGASQGGPSVQIASAEADRLALRSALQLERQRIAVVGRALSLYNVARAEYQAQATAGTPDERLEESLKAFLELFDRPRETPNDRAKGIRLLEPDALEAHLARAAAAIDSLEVKGTALTDSQAIRRFALGIPAALTPLETDQLYFAVTNLQDRLKSSLKVRLATESKFSVVYDRNTDTLVSQQDTRLRLDENPASDIDLTGFFSTTDGQLAPGLTEDLSIQEEASPAQLVSPKQPIYRLRPGSASILILKRIRRSGAAETMSSGVLALPVVAVNVNWPLSRVHALTLGLQERGNPNATWPFTLPIENSNDAALSRISVPRYSFFYSSPGIDNVSSTATADELSPSAAVGNLRALLPGSPATLRIELAPRYLSNYPSQALRIKEFLVGENIIAGVVIWLITVVGLGAFKAQ